MVVVVVVMVVVVVVVVAVVVVAAEAAAAATVVVIEVVFVVLFFWWPIVPATLCISGQICINNVTSCHTEIEVTGPTCYLTHLQYADTRPTGPITDHQSINFEITGMI